MKTAMQNHIADMKKIQEMVKSKNLDKDLEVTILESIEGCIENAESFLETEKEQIKNSYGAGAMDATSEEVLQVENYTREDIEKAYRAGEKGATYYLKDTTVILPTTYEGVDG